MLTLLFSLFSGCAHVATPAYEVRAQPYGSCITAAPRDSLVHIGDLIVGPGDPVDEDVRASWGRALRTRDSEPFRVEVVREDVVQTLDAERRRAARHVATFEEKRACEERSRQLATQWRVQERALRPQREAEALQQQREDALANHVSDVSSVGVQADFIDRQDGPELYVRRAIAGPDAPVVVVVNDGPGQSHDALRAMDVLAEHGWTVVLFDQRGVGLSARPVEDTDYSLAVQAGDLDAVRQWTGAEQIAVLGHAWGATLAIDYATRFPDNVLGVVLVGADAMDREGVSKRDSARVRTHTWAEIERLRAQVDPSCQSWARRIGHDYARLSKLKPHHVVGTCSAEVRDFVLEGVGEFDLRPGMAQLTAPVLVWYGDSDAFHINRQGIVDALSSAPVTVYEEPACGHRPMFQCPDRFYEGVVPFLDGLRP